MSQHYLEKLFSPSSIAVIGASERPNSVGMKVFKNLLQNNFEGELYAVNPKHNQVQGQPCYSSIKKIQKMIDLVIIATPAKTLPNIIVECGKKGIHTVLILSSGFSETGEKGKTLENSILNLAKQYKMRLMGPNCLGIMRPHIKMNATFDNNFAIPGKIALVSQSGALSAGILDWAMNKKIGFSTIASLGNNADINFADILDFLAFDSYTESILLYIEGIKNSRSFMSALRVAARMKPVIAIKAGKNKEGSRAALSHTGALIGSDEVFDAALRRAGAIRVLKIDDLFSASEILSSSKKVMGNRLLIITNGGGAGVMAADRASELNIELPILNNALTTELNKILPSQWSHQNPIDIIGDATPERYHAVLNICQKEPEIDAILSILVPVAMSKPTKVAKEIIKNSKKNPKILLNCWLGEKQVRSSWRLFAKHGIPYFDTPEKAVESFSYLTDYNRNQKLLMQVSDSVPAQYISETLKARTIIDSILSEGRSTLTTHESKKILKLFGIPVIDTIEADNALNAIKAANSIGYPVVMKINSPDILHKSAAGGVYLNINNEDEVRVSFEELINHIKTSYPNKSILGVTIEPEYSNNFDREVMVGVLRDIVFGPVICFGAGGTLVEVIKDKALALPPLNQFLARQLISKTQILQSGGKLTKVTENQLENIINILLRVSDMVCELPQIQEMDINPFILNETGMIAVDARIIVSQQSSSFITYSHMAIHPYPNHLSSTYQFSDKEIIIRPIRPEDAELEQDFTRKLSSESKYLRFMGHFRELSQAMLVRLTQIDYDREMALVAINQENLKQTIIGVGRYTINPDKESAEFSLVVADAWHKKGIGTVLLNSLTNIAKSKNLKTLIGMVFATNNVMIEFVKKLGFEISKSDDPTILIVTKKL